MAKREFNFPSLLPEELFGIAEQLGPSVQLAQVSTCYPGGTRLPAWWAFLLIDGQVEGTIITHCPLESYQAGAVTLAAHLAERAAHIPESGQMVTAHFVEPTEMVGGLFGGES